MNNTIAKTIARKAKDATQALTLAENLDACAFQDWEDEATIYRFQDDSYLVVSGPGWTAHTDANEVIAQYPGAAALVD